MTNPAAAEKFVRLCPPEWFRSHDFISLPEDTPVRALRERILPRLDSDCRAVFELLFVASLPRTRLPEILNISAKEIDSIYERAWVAVGSQVCQPPEPPKHLSAGMGRLIWELKRGSSLSLLAGNVNEYATDPAFFSQLLFGKGAVVEDLLSALGKRSKEGRCTRYDLLGPRARDALRTCLAEQFPTLDDISENHRLGRLFGVRHEGSSLVHALLDHHLVSPLIPRRHLVDQHAGTHYFRESMIAPEYRDLNIRRHIHFSCDSLDRINPLRPMAGVFGVGETRVAVAQAALGRGMIAPVLPKNAPLVHGGHHSMYVREDVVGKKAREENIDRYIKDQYSNLDAIVSDPALGRLLGVNDSSRSLARAVAARGTLSSEIPATHCPAKNRASFYFDPFVVGETQADANREKYARLAFPHLGRVEVVSFFCVQLGVPENKTKMAQALVSKGWTSAAIPDGQTANSGIWFDSKVVPLEIRTQNLVKHFSGRFSNLDAVSFPSKFECTILGIKRNKLAFARALVGLGVLSGEWPEGYKKPRGRGVTSLYLDARCVGKGLAAANSRKA